MDAFVAGIGHGHDDDGFHQLLADQLLSRLVHTPFDSRKGGGSIEDILAVLQIEHRITLAGQASIAAGQIDQNVPAIGQDLRSKPRILIDFSG